MPPLNPFSVAAFGASAAGASAGPSALLAAFGGPLGIAVAGAGALMGAIGSKQANDALKAQAQARRRAAMANDRNLTIESQAAQADNAKALARVAGQLRVRFGGSNEDALELQAHLDAAENSRRIQAQVNAQRLNIRTPIETAGQSILVGGLRGAATGLQASAQTADAFRTLGRIA